jgi:hypothetical protein
VVEVFGSVPLRVTVKNPFKEAIYFMKNKNEEVGICSLVMRWI